MSRRPPAALEVQVPPPSYRPHPAQARAHASGVRFLAMAAGTRGGKTKAAAVEFVLRILDDLASGRGRTPAGTGKNRRPRLHYWVVSPTAALAAEPRRYLAETIPPEWIERHFDGENALWLRGDVLVETRTAERPQNLVSVGLNGLWLDEAARIKSEAWQGNLRGRLSDFGGWCLFSSTPLGRNWFWSDIVKRGLPGPDRHPEFEAVSWTTADNPWIPRSEIESARATLPEAYFRREYLASFDAFHGLVYDEFSPALHVVRERPAPTALRRVLLAMDFGFRAPGCLLVVGDLGGRFVVLDEVYREGLQFADNRLEELAGPIIVDKARPTWVGEVKRMVARWSPQQRGAQVFCDPASPDRIHDLIRNSVNASGADNDVLYGIRQVSTVLHPAAGRPALTIHASCTNLIREASSYAWDTSRSGEPVEYPAPRQSDHALDALRYAVVELTRHAKLAVGDAPAPTGWGRPAPRPFPFLG